MSPWLFQKDYGAYLGVHTSKRAVTGDRRQATGDGQAEHCKEGTSKAGYIFIFSSFRAI